MRRIVQDALHERAPVQSHRAVLHVPFVRREEECPRDKMRVATAPHGYGLGDGRFSDFEFVSGASHVLPCAMRLLQDTEEVSLERSDATNSKARELLLTLQLRWRWTQLGFIGGCRIRCRAREAALPPHG